MCYSPAAAKRDFDSMLANANEIIELAQTLSNRRLRTSSLREFVEEVVDLGFEPESIAQQHALHFFTLIDDANETFDIEKFFTHMAQLKMSISSLV